MAEAGCGQCLAVLEGAQGTHCMQAAEQLAKAVQLVEIARLGCPSAAPREQRKAETRMLEEAAAVALQGGDHRDVQGGQLSAELMLFANGCIAPALRAVELGDQRCLAFDADLIHTVLVAVQRQ